MVSYNKFEINYYLLLSFLGYIFTSSILVTWCHTISPCSTFTHHIPLSFFWNSTWWGYYSPCDGNKFNQCEKAKNDKISYRLRFRIVTLCLCFPRIIYAYHLIKALPNTRIYIKQHIKWCQMYIYTVSDYDRHDVQHLIHEHLHLLGEACLFSLHPRR